MTHIYAQPYRPLLVNEKIEIAFLYQAGTVWPSWESVYYSCVDDARFKVRLILIKETTVEVSHANGAEEYLKAMNVTYECFENINFEEFRPHVALVQFPYDLAFHTPQLLSLRLKKKGIRIVYIPYGLEISDTPMARKDHFNSRVVEHAWRIYTSSEGIKNEYDKYCRNRAAVRVTGSPKFDCVYCKEQYPMKDSVYARAEGRKIIVWKLHFPKKNVVDGEIKMITPKLEEYIKFAKKMAEYQEFFFVVLPHPKMLGKMVASDLQGDDSLCCNAKRLIAEIQKNENAWIDSSVDYRSSFYHGDAIIMDRSAVMIEAAMLQIPILMMKNEDYNEPLTLPVQKVVETCQSGSTCYDMCSFLEAQKEAQKCDLKKREEKLEQWFPYLDGKCGQRIVNDIVDGINNEIMEKQKIKVILYGTGEVASYYMKEQGWAETSSFIIVAVADTNKNKSGTDFWGYSIILPEEIHLFLYDYIVVMTEPYFYDIQSMLVSKMFLNDKKILRLDEFLMMFYEE